MRFFLTFFLFCFFSAPSSYSQCWQKLASRLDYVIAIHEDGTLWQWGGNSYGYRPNSYPVILDTDTDWRSISTGEYFSAAIKEDGTLWMWGDNTYGQLGLGTTTNAWVPTQVGTDNNWLQVSCGWLHTVALKTDGTLWIWGRNNNGQLGNGLNRTSRLTPGQLGTENTWVEISAGRNNSLMRKSDNTLWFVGACYTSSIVSQLRQVGSTSDWKTMAAGTYTDYGIKQNGTLWKWVNSNGGPSGLAQVGTQNNWNKVDNGIGYSQEDHALIIKTNGTLWAIGKNQFGQMGTGNLTSYTDIPVQIGTDTDWKQAVAGSHYTLALKTNNSFWACGRTNHAQFGNGMNKDVMRPINTTTHWKEVYTSRGSFNGHTLAIQEDGTLWSWGPNQDGQLGIGPPTYAHKPLPQQVGTASNWKSVTGGFHFSVGVKEDGTLWGWGRNGSGQIGLGGAWSTTSPTQIGTDTDWVMAASSSSNTIAIKENGTLWACGFNQNGELGIGNTSERDLLVQVGTDTDWLFVSAGDAHSLAIKADGSLWSWGSNQHGQLGRSGLTTVPARVGTDTWLTVSGGGLHTLGIKSDSTLWAWGRNFSAQLGDGTENNKSTPYQISSEHLWKNVSGGYEHSLALRVDSTLWGWGRNAGGSLSDSLSYVEFLSKVYYPRQIGLENKWDKIAGGVLNSIFVNDDGLLFTCGDGYSYEFQTNFPQLGYVYWSPQQISFCDSCPSTSSEFTQSICPGDSVLFANQYFHDGGVYYDTLVNAMGCDSIVSLHLIVKPLSYFTDVQTACTSYQWIDGTTYTQNNNTATYIYEGGANNGCDSIVTLNLTILQPSYSIDVQSACESFQWINGTTYTQSNNSATYTFIDGAANGCDSIVTLNLTILQPSYSIDANTACSSYSWIDGNIYTENNNTATFIYQGAASNGCDSIVTLNLTIHQSVEAIDVHSACSTFTWIDGNVYTESNNTATYVYEGGSSFGCDSIVTLNLTLHQAVQAIDIQTACSSFTWIDGITYVENNNSATYTYPGGSNFGCDSTVTLNLTIHQPVQAIDVQTACNAFTWIDGITYTQNNNSATYTYEGGSSFGCDSIVTLNLSIYTINNEVQLINNTLTALQQAGVSYQWVDCDNNNLPIADATSSTYTPSESGNFAVTLSNENCTTTSLCTEVTIISVNEVSANTRFSIYPNPTSGIFTLEYNEPAMLEILDLTGRVVESFIHKGVQSQIDLKNQTSGIYFIRIVTQHQTLTKRLVIQK